MKEFETKILSVVGVLFLLGMVPLLMAATKGDQPPKATSGAVQVASYDAGSVSADGGLTPTKIFTGMTGRNAFAIYNNGSATIWCGWNKSVTPVNGFPVAAGATLSVDLVYNASGDTDLYCIGTFGRDQDLPADTRWIQIK